MLSFQYLILFHLIYWLSFGSDKILAEAAGSLIGETIKIEFFTKQRKIIVEGVRNESWTGVEYFSFRGIPYAKSPIGELRFKDPQQLNDLPSYIDARYDGHDCPSIYATNASEDCLTLNIYTPTISETASLPVLVFVHPGGLYIGSSLSTFISPAYMLSKAMVVVTFNYRIGTLGFLQLGIREVPGNAGFKDQVLALRWIKQYINHFGGNTQDITLMGYSAGALSTFLHLVSPMSQGLFQKAIIMSGSLPPQTEIRYRAQLQLLRKQAAVLNCTEVSNETDILVCLQRFNGNEIAATLRMLFEFGRDNPIYVFRPIIESDFGQERFLIEHPYESLKRGAFAKIPILLGFTNGEFCQSAVDIYKDSKLAIQLYEDFEKLAPVIFMYDGDKKNLSWTTQRLKEYYLPNYTELNENNLARFCDFFSDGLIRFGAQRLAELASPHTTVFPYSFEFEGDYSNLDYAIKPARVEHMDDLMYLFEMSPKNFSASQTNAAMIRQYTKFVYEFVKKGSSLSGHLPTYPTGYTKIYRALEFQPGTFFAQDTYELWKRLFL